MSTYLDAAAKSANVNLSNNNLTATGTSSSEGLCKVRATNAKTSGKWYFESKFTAVGANTTNVGICNDLYALVDDTMPGDDDTNACGYYCGGVVFATSNTVGGLASYYVPDVIGVAADIDNNTVTFYKNNEFVYKMALPAAINPCYPLLAISFGCVMDVAFVATAGTYAAPEGYQYWDAGAGAETISDDIIINTCRKVTKSESINFSTKRKIQKADAISIGIKRKLYNLLTPSVQPYTSLQISLNSKTLTDTFTLITTADAPLNSRLQADLFNFKYFCEVDKKTYDKQLITLDGAYDVAELLRRPVKFTITNDSSALTHFNAACSALNKQAIANFDNFNISAITDKPTLQDFINRIFSWSTNIPHKQINVFCRNNIIYALQRGKETASYTPVLVNNLIKTVSTYINSQTSTDTDGTTNNGYLVGDYPTSGDGTETTDCYISGTFSAGDAQMVYSFGLLRSESHGSGENYTVTTYDYNYSFPPALLLRKDTIIGLNGKRKITTTYSYDSQLTDVAFLYQEETIEITKNEDTDETTRKTTLTRYSDLGQGFYGITTEVNGVLTDSQVCQGKPGGAASAAMIRQTSKKPRPVTVTDNNYNVPTNIPVTDEETLSRIATELKWLDEKTEERISFICYDSHIIDFTEKIIIDGNAYYLEKNTINQTPRKISQSVEVVRYY